MIHSNTTNRSIQQSVGVELEVPSIGPYNIRVPISVTYLNWTPLFDHGHQTNMCLEEVGLYAPNIITRLGLQVSIVGGWYMTMT